MPSPEAKPERVVGMRRIALRRAGYDEFAAEELAGRLDILLDDALRLVRDGVEPETARAMLLSGNRPPV
jgi:hypothetical protein